MNTQTCITINTRDMGNKVNCYVILDSPGINSIIGSIKWDPSVLEFDKFTINPHLLSFNEQGDMQVSRWNMINDTFAKNDGFLGFLIGCNINYEMKHGALGLISLNKKTFNPSGFLVSKSEFPVNWSAADKDANPVSIDVGVGPMAFL